VFLTHFLLLVWVRFAAVGMQLGLRSDLLRGLMKLFPLESRKQMWWLQTEAGWKHRELQSCLSAGQGIGVPPPTQRNTLGVKPARFRNGSLGGCRSGARGSAQHLLRGTGDLESPKVLSLQWVGLLQGASRYPQPRQERLPSPSLLAAKDAQPAASWFVRPLAHRSEAAN